MYYNSVGHNSTLILGITPDPDGLIPQADHRRMQEFGAEVSRKFDSTIVNTSGKEPY